MRALSQILLTAVLAAGSAAADDWSKTWSVGNHPDLRVETDDAAVTIRAGSDRTIAAIVTTRGWKIAPGEVQIRETQQGDHVDLSVRIPHRPFTYSSMGRSIRVELHVPRQLRADIRTGDGGIDVEGINGEMRLHTGDGHIEALSLDGSLNAESGDGHVRLRGRFDQLAVHTGDGGIDADVLPGSRMNGNWRIETGDGGVTLRLPDRFGADLELHTGDGGIEVDLPELSGSGRHQEHDLHARLNGGGPSFTVHTGDGSIHLRRL